MTTTTTLAQYIEAKITMLHREFHIRLTKDEAAHMRSLQSEIQVDNYCRKIFADKL